MFRDRFARPPESKPQARGHHQRDRARRGTSPSGIPPLRPDMFPSWLATPTGGRLTCEASDTFGTLSPDAIEGAHNCSRAIRATPEPAGSAAMQLPDELWIEILSHLEWDEVIALRPVCRRVAALALAPSLHRNLTLYNLPLCPLPEVLRDTILPHVRHLTLHLGAPPPHWLLRRRQREGWAMVHPTTALMTLLRAIPDDGLLSLAIPFSSHILPWEEVGPEIARIGGRLERLNLATSGLAGQAWLKEWGRTVGTRGRGLRDLDLSGNPITALPQMPWATLERLSLRSCFLIPGRRLAAFLTRLPPSLRHLNLSDLHQLSLEDLYGLRVTVPNDDDEPATPTALREIRLVGIDHLTRSDVRALQRHWADQRAECPPLEPSSPSLSDTSTMSSSPTMPMTPMPPDQLVTPSSSPPNHTLLGGDPWAFAGMGAALPCLPGAYSTPPQQQPWTKHANEHPSHEDKVAIVHSALLETDDEEGYRQFIGQVVGGTLVRPQGGELLS